MAEALTIKRGASIAWSLQLANPDGTAVDLTSSTLTMQVRDTNNALIATLPITLPGPAGAVEISVPSTASWPLGTLRCDVRLASGGVITFSDTFAIFVARSVTQL